MTSPVLYRSIALIALGLVAYLVLELAYLGQLRLESTRHSANAQQLADMDSRLTDLRSRLISTPVSAPSTRQVSFVEGTPDQALISLQEVTQALLTTSGGTAMAIQGSQAPSGATLTRLTVLVRATLSEQALLTFVRDVESLPNSIFVQKLDVLPPPAGASGTAGLDVTIVIGATHSNAV